MNEEKFKSVVNGALEYRYGGAGVWEDKQDSNLLIFEVVWRDDDGLLAFARSFVIDNAQFKRCAEERLLMLMIELFHNQS